MTNKIKIFFGILTLFTAVSIFSWVDYFNQGLASSFNIKDWANGFSLKTDNDPDKDGLNNLDESYWNTDFQNPDTDGDGFLDGEEVASGHDPTKPGPDDSLKDINLTQKLSELTSAGLVEGSLKLSSPELEKSLANLVDYTTDNANFSINGIVSPEILTLVGSDKKNQEDYLNKIYEIIRIFLTSYGKELSSLQQKLDTIGFASFSDPAVVNYFSEQEKIFTSVFNKALEISVPKNWADEHLHLLGEIKIAAESNRAIASGKDDPVKASIAFETFFGVLDRTPNWSWSYINKNRKEGVNNYLIESLTQ